MVDEKTDLDRQIENNEMILKDSYTPTICDRQRSTKTDKIRLHSDISKLGEIFEKDTNA